MNEAVHPEQYSGYGGKTWNKRGGASKETAIKKAIERKEASIQKFTDTKSTQIAVSSAFNGAAAIVTALIQYGAITGNDFWAEHEKWYYEYLERYGSAQSEAVYEVANKVGRKKEVHDGAKDDAAMDGASQEII